MRKKVVAIACSDIHLSLRAPLCRTEEKSWLGAMAWGMLQIAELCQKHKAPLLIAGDIFDKWNMPAELINWALNVFPPHTYAIPGNHDLPMHQAELIHRSAYYTLVEANAIKQLPYKGPMGFLTDEGEVFVYAVPFDGKIPQPVKKSGLHICVIHQYLWVPGCGYNGATQDTRVGVWARQFREFDVVVVGDNHIAFDRTLRNGTHIINCGTVFRRKTSEIAYTPRVGIIYSNGEVGEHRLDCSQDKISKALPLCSWTPEDETDMEDVMLALSGIGKTSANFKDAIMEAIRIRKVTKQVKRLLLEAME